MPKIYHMNAKTSKISQSLFNHKQCLSIELFCQHASTTSVQQRAILALLHQRMDYLQIHSIPKVSNKLLSQSDQRKAKLKQCGINAKRLHETVLQH